MRLNPCKYPEINGYEYPTNTLNLDMGCAMKPEPGFEGVDICSPLAKYHYDLNKPLPFENNSIGYIRASHICEHLKNWEGFMDECHRILKDGPLNRMFVVVPRPDHWTAIGDPEHCRFFHPNHFMYLTPYWYYENRMKKWEVIGICWCQPGEIRCILRPIKSEEKMRELLADRDRIRAANGHDFIFFDGDENGAS